MPRLGLASFRRRILIRLVFLLLALATLALAVVLLQDEKARSLRNYRRQDFRAKTLAEVLARLRQPAGLLALLNPQAQGDTAPLRPLVLPYGALDFDDQFKAQQAVETAGCSVQYPDGSSICVAIGNNPYAGGFIYLVGSFRAGDLAWRDPGELDLQSVHRARIRLELRGELRTWIAPFERLSLRGEPLVRGRLTAFAAPGDATRIADDARPLRDFRGWLWQSASCSAGGELPDCARRVSFSIRLPVDAYPRSPAGNKHPQWPPPDLDRIRVHLQVLAPGTLQPVFDSNAEGALAPASLADLARRLRPGETDVDRARRADRREAPIVVKATTTPRRAARR